MKLEKMKFYKVAVAKVVHYERLRNSTLGNPQYYLVMLTKENDYIGGKTKANASLGYSCLNHLGDYVKVHYHYNTKGNIEFDYFDDYYEE